MGKNEDHIPFGEEWKKMVNKLSKEQIIDNFAELARKRLRLKRVLHSRCNAKICKHFRASDIPGKCACEADCIVTQTLDEDI